jgi:hypothetical protein
MYNKESPLVSVIILNWNGWQDTIECLESIYQMDYPNFNVIVIDNGSEDESIEKIKEYYKIITKIKSKFFEYKDNKTIEIKYINENFVFKHESCEHIKLLDRGLILIENNKNYGYAEGNNIGINFAIKYLEPKYILLLNNDTVVHTKFLKNLVDVAIYNKHVGVLGPSIYLYDDENQIQSFGAKINWNKGNVTFIKNPKLKNKEYDTIQVDYVEGCALLINKEVIERVGYLNSKYFCYWEEADFCVRASKANYNILCVPQAKIWHKHSKSVEKIGGFYSYYMTRNMFWFMKTHANRIQYIIFLLYFFMFRFWILSYVYLIVQRNKESYISFCKGIIDG